MTEMQAWEVFVGLNWTDRFSDPPEEPEIEIEMVVDTSKLTESEFEEFLAKVEELSRYNKDYVDRAYIKVDYDYEGEGDTVTGLKLDGWCYEDVYEKLFNCLDDYDVKY